jgi:hypothetical protein
MVATSSTGSAPATSFSAKPRRDAIQKAAANLSDCAATRVAALRRLAGRPLSTGVTIGRGLLCHPEAGLSSTSVRR